MTVVVDTSVALAWFLPDESNSMADALLTQVVDNGAVVPALFPVELGNALVMAVRRSRIDRDYRRLTFERLSQLGLKTDQGGDAWVREGAMELADEHGLTLYDGIYLELALRLELPLATLDKRLARAAATVGLLYG